MRAARAGVLMGSLLVSACGVTQARSLVRDGMSSRARPAADEGRGARYRP